MTENSASSLLSTASEENTEQPVYGATSVQDGQNLGKFAQPTVIGNVSYNNNDDVFLVIHIDKNNWVTCKLDSQA